MKKNRRQMLFFALALLSPSASAYAQQPDLAKIFGSLESVADTSLSPDGTKFAYVEPSRGQANILYTVDLSAPGSPARSALATSGKPERIRWCEWISNTRLVCNIWGMLDNKNRNDMQPIPFSRLYAVNADGSALKMVSTRQNENAEYVSRWGGSIVDLLPNSDGEVLLGRVHVPESDVSTLVKKTKDGYGVDQINTLSLRSKRVVSPIPSASEYISDGNGNVRIRGIDREESGGYVSSATLYSYRRAGQDKWEELSSYDYLSRQGFNPYAVDPRTDEAFGFERQDGRLALYKIKLDGTKAKSLVYSHPEVDVDGLVLLGRDRRVVGVSYATDKRYVHYFDPEFSKLQQSLTTVLPKGSMISFDGASSDAQKLVVRVSSDVDPGQYFLFNRSKKQMSPLLASRANAEKLKLSTVASVSFPAQDGTKIPGYLTLPPNSAGKKLPAIVMPHGGPEARDEWGFDWLAQFFAQRGYVVLQPNFRGSFGYGDAWFKVNGFQSWKDAVGDVNDGGRWLVGQGIADPAKLAIVGWSYGGYAALQSAVLDPDLFKAIVAIAPVADLAKLKEDSLFDADYRSIQKYVGSGPHVAQGSPAQNAERFKAPVLLFHGTLDRNVSVHQSRLMADRLKSANKEYSLTIYEGLEHQLADGDIRADMLRKSDAFLRQKLGL